MSGWCPRIESVLNFSGIGVRPAERFSQWLLR
jgi:hypothetical protein